MGTAPSENILCPGAFCPEILLNRWSQHNQDAPPNTQDRLQKAPMGESKPESPASTNQGEALPTNHDGTLCPPRP